eukprot:scaffold17220_cov65-Phaeocystis_antarctica.AAC.2
MKGGRGLRPLACADVGWVLCRWRCSHSRRPERLGRTLRSARQLASCSTRALPPKFATRSSVLIESNSGTLSATAHCLARLRNVGTEIVESKSRTRALIAMLARGVVPEGWVDEGEVCPEGWAAGELSTQTRRHESATPAVRSHAGSTREPAAHFACVKRCSHAR